MAAEEEDIEVLRRKLREKEKLLEVQNVRIAAFANIFCPRSSPPDCRHLCVL